MTNIAIFASGSGTNAQKIIDYFEQSTIARVALIVSNKSDAGVLSIAKKHDIPTVVINRQSFYEQTALLDILEKYDIGFLVLAGFLWLVPAYLVQAFPHKIINIHPALLPKFGGKGMYGHHVHHAVKASGATESGITIHFVNTQYDEGDIIFQATCAIHPDDSAEEIGRKVLKLEHEYFPKTIEKLLRASE
jgi:phosphoribosylglycinamide formyltransferase-1